MMNNDPNLNDPTTPMYQNPHPPPSRQPPRLVQWYRAKMARRPVVTGCLTAVAALVVLLLCGTVSGIANGGLQSLAANPTPTQVVQHTSIPVTPHHTATPKPTSTPVPTATPLPTATPIPTTIPGVNGNPWGYDFNPGAVITNPPSSFCAYFDCIASFWNGTGYVVECSDTTYSKSGGHTGSCSKHGGDLRTLYQH